MNKKKLALGTGGFLLYMGLPLIPTAYYYDILVTTDVRTTLSSITMLVILIGISVFKLIFRKEKVPFNINILWVLIFVLCTALQPIIEPLKAIALFGIGGSASGSYLLNKITKIEKEEEKQEFANIVADKMKGDNL